MRFHRRYPLLQTWLRRPDARDLITASDLAIARFEPTIQLMTGGGVLDVLFSDGNRIAAIPFVEVTPTMLLERERSPIMWPSACEALPSNILEEIEAQIVPWLQSLTLARQLNVEVVRSFSARIPQDVFGGARAAKLLGAGPYPATMTDCAPYIYAMRFAAGKRVHIADPNGATGAVLLAAVAEEVRADLRSEEANALARRWFGDDLFGRPEGGCDVAIHGAGVRELNASTTIMLDGSVEGGHAVHVAHPVPTDAMISFDPEDSQPARTFGVAAPHEIALRSRPDGGTAAMGGSAGRILLLVRENWERAPDADVDEAHALGERLRAEGFSVHVSGAAAALRDEVSPDMVHVFTLHHAAEMLEAVKHYHARGVPVVATAALPRVLNDTVATPHLLLSAFVLGDEAAILDRLDLLDLHARKATFQDAAPREGYRDAIRSLLEHASVVLVNSDAEEESLRGTYGYKGRVMPAYPVTLQSEPSAMVHIAGSRPFAFVHAPIEARANLPLVARAAAECGIPILAAGPVVEPNVQRTLVEILGADYVHLASPAPAELESLYRAARLYVDLSWMPQGLSRIARAVACGAPALVSERSHAPALWPSIATAAPGSFSSIRTAMSAAWSSPRASTARPAQEAFLSAVAAYAQAQHVGLQA